MLSSSDGNDNETYEEKLLIAVKTEDGLRVHQVKTNSIQTQKYVRIERKHSIK